MRKVHRLVILALLVGGPAFAQNANEQPASAQIILPQQIGIDRLRAASRGFIPVGEPVVSETAQRGEAILTAPYRLRREGRLAADIATSTLRMKQGAPVAFLSFRPFGPQQYEPIRAWCGPGEVKAMFSWSAQIVCMVEAADGKAALVTPAFYAASWWAVSSLNTTRREDQVDRVEVLPAETASEFELVISYQRQRNNGLAIRSQIVGPAVQPDKTARGLSHDRVMPASDTGYSLPYDGLNLTLNPSAEGASLGIVSERVAPALDLSLFEEEPIDMTDEETEQPEQAGGIAPTPYVIGALRFDPTQMTAQNGIIPRGGTMLTGKASYAVTGRLTKQLQMTAPLIRETAEAGTIMHQLEIIRSTELGTLTSNHVWCGAIGSGTIWSRKPTIKCLAMSMRTGVLEANWPNGSTAWLATTDRFPAIVGTEAIDFDVEVSQTPILPPVDVHFQLHRINANEAIVRVMASKDGEDVVVLQINAPFNNGTATIPLWSHRLKLIRSGEGVSLEFTHDGDGISPVLIGYYPA